LSIVPSRSSCHRVRVLPVLRGFVVRLRGFVVALGREPVQGLGFAGKELPMLMKILTAAAIVIAGMVSTTVAQGGQTAPPAAANVLLVDAARAGDVAAMEAALAKGAMVNGTARYNVTPLIAAAMNGHVDAVKFLVARGADLNVEDSFYRFSAGDAALVNGHPEVALFLLERGWNGASDVLMFAVQSDNAALVNTVLARKVTREEVEMAFNAAQRMKRTALVPLLQASLDSLPASAPAFAVDPATLPRYAGTYRAATAGITLTVTAQEGALVAQIQGQPSFRLAPSAPHVFRVVEVNATLTFNERGGVFESIQLVQGPATLALERVTNAVAAAPAPVAPLAPPAPVAPLAPPAPRNWPSFRGVGGSGNADGQRAVAEWDVASGKNIKWKTPIPGMANSSPIVWGNRVFVTTAISKGGDKTFRTGLYGDVKPVDDLSEHAWMIYALDKASGKILWQRTAFAGTPKTRRHPKATQANSTPVTDGRRVVAAFGSIGLLVAWDMNGKELWRSDIGILESGWFFDPTVQWGHSSSPIIHDNSVILQADMQKGSYIAAWDLSTGKQLWKTERSDEIPTWGTPAVVVGRSGRSELVTNGTKIRAYDAASGKLLWTLGPNSEVTVGTPVTGHGLVFVTGGYPPVRPIYAIRPGATGDISLPKGSESSDAIAWSNMTEGTYIPSPLVYGEYLFTMNNNGIVNAYGATTGQRAFRGRIGEGGAFSASPVAADGRLYVASEDGEVYVVTAGPGLTQVAKNDMKEVIMATPAISDGVIVIRTLGHVYGIGE
jgi:outer membrane protein assembly factor BamB